MAPASLSHRIVCFLAIFSIATAQNLSTTSTESSVESSTTQLSSSFTSEISSLISSSTSTASAAANTSTSDDLVEENEFSGYVQGTPIPPDESYNVDVPDPGDGEPGMPLGLPLQDAQVLNTMETTFFTYFTENAPAGGDAPTKLPNVTCPSSLTKRASADNCPTYTNLGINIHFHNVRNPVGKLTLLGQQAVTESRVKAQVDRLNLSYDRLGIHFNYVPMVHRWIHEKFSDHTMSINDPLNKRIKKQTRIGGRTDLNVWIVEEIHDGEITRPGYSSYPQDNPDVDGVVMTGYALNTNFRNTLVHEVGHWMGLKHTFGKEDLNCAGDDSLPDTERTNGTHPMVDECIQTYCNGKVARVENHMSYSWCRGSKNVTGKIVINLDAFSTMQKARMYSQFLRFRQLVRSACVPKDPSTGKRDVTAGSSSLFVDTSVPDSTSEVVEYDQLLVKRKLLTAQNILDGTCPDPSAPDSPDVVASNGAFGTSGVPTATGTQTIVVGSASATFKGTGGTTTVSGSAAATSSKSAAGRTPSMGSPGLLTCTIISLVCACIGAFIIL